MKQKFDYKLRLNNANTHRNMKQEIILNKNQIKLLRIAFYGLVLHLLFANTSLLIDLHKVIDDVNELTNIEYASKFIYSLTYSVITILLLSIYPKMIIVIATAFFDGFAVYLKYNIDHPEFLTTASVFYGLYTLLIVIISGYVAAKYISQQQQQPICQVEEDNSKKDLDKKVKSLQNSINATKNEEKKQQKIAELEKIKKELNKERINYT